VAAGAGATDASSPAAAGAGRVRVLARRSVAAGAEDSLADADVSGLLSPSPVSAAATAVPEISAEPSPTRTALVPSNTRRSPMYLLPPRLGPTLLDERKLPRLVRAGSANDDREDRVTNSSAGMPSQGDVRAAPQAD